MATRTNKKTDDNAFRVVERMMSRNHSGPTKIPSLKEQIEAAEKEEFNIAMETTETRISARFVPSAREFHTR